MKRWCVRRWFEILPGPSEMTLVENMSGGCRVSKYPENMRKEKKEILQSELEIILSTHE
jgi:hypothetical protein